MMASNPMIAGNPAMQAQMEAMMANPEMMQRALDPANMAAMLQLQQSGLLGYYILRVW